MHNSTSFLENETHKLLWDFVINGSPNLSQTTRPYNIQQKKKKKKKKKRICRIVDFVVPEDNRI